MIRSEEFIALATVLMGVVLSVAWLATAVEL
jgi:hypothetical protein